jgi:uncharacterized protein (DUF488 family)
MEVISQEDFHMKRIVTIGVYGYTVDEFFQALQTAGVEVFCDIRWRRGVRGADYAFANHKHLQTRLDSLGIVYIHRRDLAPTPEIRQLQKIVDKSDRTAKRKRTNLSPDFIKLYKDEILVTFDQEAFWEALPVGTQVVALFCVEREPTACHRLLVADALEQLGGAVIEHLTP